MQSGLWSGWLNRCLRSTKTQQKILTLLIEPGQGPLALTNLLQLLWNKRGALPVLQNVSYVSARLLSCEYRVNIGHFLTATFSIHLMISVLNDSEDFKSYREDE